MLPTDSIDKAFQALKKKAAETQFKFSAEKAKQKLRPYQIDTLLNLERLLKDGSASVAVQLPTGAGKTYLIHAFIHRHYVEKNKNVIVVTPSWEIANQHAMTMCQQFKGGRENVCRMGGSGQLISLFPEYRLGMKGKIIITTSALFYAREETLRSQVSAALVVIDEGHHGWKKKRLNSVQNFARDVGAASIFLTATPPRNMESLPFAAQVRYLDLVPTYLVPCEVVRLETGQEFKPVLKNGLMSQSSRVEISSRETRYEKIVAESIPHMRGQTIYYAGSVKEAEGVVAEFAKHNVSATVVHSKWEKKGDKINALAIEKFRQGEARVLVNVQMLAMGFDVPCVGTIIVARPVESDTLFTQMVGRGARPSPGKENFILIDVHDTIHKPDVAKIFEHDHLFYSDVSKDTPKVAVAPVLPIRRLGAVDLNGFPYHEGQLNERALADEGLVSQEPVEFVSAAWALTTR